MMDTETYQWILKSFNIGTSTAENDPFLQSAQIDTTEFHDLYWEDRIDLVRGIKGSGKTALYRVLFFLHDIAFERKKMVMCFGIETEGVPQFKSYSKTFDKFSEDDFESFWQTYFVYLIFQAAHEKKDQLPSAVGDAIEELFRTLTEDERALLGKKLSIRETLMRWLKHIHDRKNVSGVEASVQPKDVGGNLIFYPSLKLNLQEGQADAAPVEPPSIQLKDRLIAIAQSAGLRFWVLLDRLDEVFLRRSDTEFRALRGLLRAAYRFSNPHLRIKIFLREDIFNTLAKGGFTALTHVADRSSNVMSWSDEKLLLLVAKRLAHMPTVAQYYGFNPDQVEGNQAYQQKLFDTVFPRRIGRQPAFEWVLTHLRDGNGQVTPRDVIDSLNAARTKQVQLFETAKQVPEHLIEEQAIRLALDEVSTDKRDKYLFAEFPHLQDDIRVLQGGYSHYSAEALERKLGLDYRKKVDDLRSIGLFEYDKKKAMWRLPHIWRKGLDITQGVAKV